MTEELSKKIKEDNYSIMFIVNVINLLNKKLSALHNCCSSFICITLTENKILLSEKDFYMNKQLNQSLIIKQLNRSADECNGSIK